MWQPQTIRRCTIRGLCCLAICGNSRSGNNYAVHSEDYTTQIQPFGGSFSTTTWSLKVLYDEHQKFMNKWSYPNTQLDLARYKGVTFWFYRDLKTDYIVTWSRNPPFKLNKYSSPMLHPGMMMQRKKKLVVPSYQTRPRGKKRYRVRIRPPNMFEDKWYTQEDLCPVNLVSLAVSAASLTHPFCPPLTNNPCITFQVLKDIYYKCIGISSDYTTEYNELETKLYQNNCTYFQTTQVIAQLYPGFRPAQSGGTNKTLGETVTWLKQEGQQGFKTNNNPVFGFCSYKPKKDEIVKARDWFWTQLSAENDLHSTYGKATLKQFEYHIGFYSSIFLSPKET